MIQLSKVWLHTCEGLTYACSTSLIKEVINTNILIFTWSGNHQWSAVTSNQHIFSGSWSVITILLSFLRYLNLRICVDVILSSIQGFLQSITDQTYACSKHHCSTSENFNTLPCSVQCCKNRSLSIVSCLIDTLITEHVRQYQQQYQSRDIQTLQDSTISRNNMQNVGLTVCCRTCVSGETVQLPCF